MPAHPRPDLRRLPILARLPETDLLPLQAGLERRELAAGEVLVRPGEFGDFLALVESGEVALESSTGQRRMLRAGESFGEGMLRFGVPASFTAQARRASVVWLLARSEWLAIEFKRRYLNPDAAQPVDAGRPAQAGMAAAAGLAASAEAVTAAQKVAETAADAAGPACAGAASAPDAAAPRRFERRLGCLALIAVLLMALAMLGPRLLPAAETTAVDRLLSAGRGDLSQRYLQTRLALRQVAAPGG
ncbi:MAG: cyclic nucleotide-binding domain-containing protein, partial [Chloroflexota bacterium]